MGQMISLLEKIFKVYNQVRKKHEEHRKSHIEHLAEALEKQGKGKKATIIRNLLHIEAQRSMFRRIAVLRGKDNSNCRTTQVTITKQDGTTEDITDKRRMETAIIRENQCKYHQTESSCPFLRPPLYQQFGPLGNAEPVDAVAEGNYKCPSAVDDYTKEYIKACEQKPQVKEAVLFSNSHPCFP